MTQTKESYSCINIRTELQTHTLVETKQIEWPQETDARQYIMFST